MKRLTVTAFRALLAAALFVSLAPPAFAQHPEIDKAAAELAISMQKESEQQIGNTRIAVIPFARFHGLVSELGVSLADELAQSLANQPTKFKIVDKKQLMDFIEQERLLVAQWSDAKAARWLAGKLGVQFVVVGTIEKSGQAIGLRLQLQQVENGKKIGEAAATIPLTEELEKWFSSSPLEFFSVIDESTGRTSPPAGVFRVGREGVGYPGCAFCPDPSYAQSARDAKFSGTVVLQIMVNPNGRASNIAIYKGLPFDLNQQAIKAVQKWSFKPARNREGKPVPVEVMIEVTFRLF